MLSAALLSIALYRLTLMTVAHVANTASRAAFAGRLIEVVPSARIVRVSGSWQAFVVVMTLSSDRDRQ